MKFAPLRQEALIKGPGEGHGDMYELYMQLFTEIQQARFTSVCIFDPEIFLPLF